jgi:hypothetical protein
MDLYVTSNAGALRTQLTTASSEGTFLWLTGEYAEVRSPFLVQLNNRISPQEKYETMDFNQVGELGNQLYLVPAEGRPTYSENTRNTQQCHYFLPALALFLNAVHEVCELCAHRSCLF